jgi:hypothetical protein
VLQEFLGRRPKLLGSIGQVWLFAQICQIKRQQEEIELTWHGMLCEEKDVFQPIFPIQMFALGLNRGITGGVRGEVWIIIKQCQAQACLGRYRWLPLVVHLVAHCLSIDQAGPCYDESLLPGRWSVLQRL